MLIGRFIEVIVGWFLYEWAMMDTEDKPLFVVCVLILLILLFGALA